MSSVAIGRPKPIDAPRQERMVRELMHAYGASSQQDGIQLAKEIAATFAKVTLRRGKNAARLVWWLGEATVIEVKNGHKAFYKNRFWEHTKSRGEAAIRASGELLESGRKAIADLHSWVQTNPSQSIPQLLVGVIVFLTASGGPDGDGGVPDLDLIAGIGAHRSIFTHSIISGAVLETGIWAVARSLEMFYQKLPNVHDQLWDVIEANRHAIFSAAAKGASAGIAYHLLIDGTLQAAPYHDLPISLPMEAHETILLTNALAESVDVMHKEETLRRQTRDRMRCAKETTILVWLLIAAHKEARKQAFTVPDWIQAELLPDHLAIVRKYGNWMENLAEGRLFVLTESQEAFVAVSQGWREARTEHERAWATYTRIRAQRRNVFPHSSQ